MPRFFMKKSFPFPAPNYSCFYPTACSICFMLSLTFRCVFFSLTLLTGILLAACEGPESATLPGRWNLVSAHIVQKDVTTNVVVHDYILQGKSGDYLALSDTLYQEFSGNRLNFEMPYAHQGNTITLKGIIKRMDQTREIRKLTADRLVLFHKSNVIILNQSLDIEATYSR